jgi:hypothetical protein
LRTCKPQPPGGGNCCEERDYRINTNGTIYDIWIKKFMGKWGYRIEEFSGGKFNWSSHGFKSKKRAYKDAMQIISTQEWMKSRGDESR